MSDQHPRRARVTVPEIRARKAKAGERLVMVTAYDAPGARMADAAGVDMILVGDSLAMVVLGYDNTLQVGIADMAHHTAAVCRARPRALVVADMPWLSYHKSIPDAIDNAAVLVRAGAQAVKLEGGSSRAPVVRALVDAEVQVVGHLGLTPQSLHRMGGFVVQGKDVRSADQLVVAGKALEDAGCFAIVAEGVPAEVGSALAGAVGVPVIGIGAGAGCDGQVLVFHDVLGLDVRADATMPRFVRRYASLGAEGVAALERFADDVRTGRFPAASESYAAGSSLAGWQRERGVVP